MKDFSFDPVARIEYREALDYYSERSSFAAGLFLDRVEDSIRIIRSFPEAFPFIDRKHGVRSANVVRFPYSLLYREKPNLILIMAIAHQSREPGYWKSRLKNADQ